MSEVHFRAKARRVGNSLTVIVPAKERKRAAIRDGQELDVTIRTERRNDFEALGFDQRAGVKSGRFRRRKENLWRDRL